MFDVYYGGDVQSLTGLRSRTKTIGVESKLVAYGSLPPLQILDANPRRVSALIFNDGAVVVSLYLSANGAGYILLPQYSSLQIDVNFPIVGAVWLVVPSETPATVSVMEISVFE